MRVVASVVSVGLSLLACGSLLGCSDNDSMLFVRGVMAAESGSCELTPEEGAMLRLKGTWDVAFGRSYQAALLVGNQLASRGQKTRSRTETSGISLEGAEVSVRLPSGDLLLPTFTAPGTGFIEVGSGQDTGYGIMSVMVIPRSSSDEASIKEATSRRYVIAEMKVFGRTLGGQDIESGIFKFPIDVCSGCLVDFPMSSLDETTGMCLPSADAEASRPCVVGQDDVISCSACAGTEEVCKAP